MAHARSCKRVGVNAVMIKAENPPYVFLSASFLTFHLDEKLNRTKIMTQKLCRTLALENYHVFIQILNSELAQVQ